MTEQDKPYLGDHRLQNALTHAGAMLSGAVIAGICIKPLNSNLLIAGLATLGAFHGWHQANAALEQHDALVKERDMYRNTVNSAVHQGLIQVAPGLIAQKA